MALLWLKPYAKRTLAEARAMAALAAEVDHLTAEAKEKTLSEA